MIGPRRSQAGAALIEFTLALPLLLMLLVGIIEMGRLTYYDILVGNAAYAGAFYGSRDLSTARDADRMSAAALADGQNVPQIAVSPAPKQSCMCYDSATGASTPLPCDSNGSTCATGSHRVMYVQVTVTGRVNTLFDYRALGMPDPWIITRTATIRVSNTTE